MILKLKLNVAVLVVLVVTVSRKDKTKVELCNYTSPMCVLSLQKFAICICKRHLNVNSTSLNCLDFAAHCTASAPCDKASYRAGASRPAKNTLSYRMHIVADIPELTIFLPKFEHQLQFQPSPSSYTQGISYIRHVHQVQQLPACQLLCPAHNQKLQKKLCIVVSRLIENWP